MNVANLFPVPVAMFEYGKPSNKELEVIKSFEMGENLSNRHSINHNVLDDERLVGLKSFIEDSLKVYISETICPSPDMTYYITNSWINITQGGQHHQVHSHQNSIVSGTFYVDVENDKDKITFTQEATQNPLMSDMMIHDIDIRTPYNCLEWDVPIQTGQLLFFPSSVRHGVPPREDRTTDRISLSFNTFVKGLVSKGDRGVPRIYI
tara:strand:- start:601 stop:1221 length:621 start_codon:yes stop_codon:yes gene_type:complete